MKAPAEFSRWMSGHVANDKKFGRSVFRYHPRSDAHSKKICELVFADLLNACPVLADHVRSRAVVGLTNAAYRAPNGKTKTLDLGIGTPATSAGRLAADRPMLPEGDLLALRIAVEAKQCMTEHSKTQPRIFDELSSAHEIVHQGDRSAIAAGVVVLNASHTYASPTRQTASTGPLVVTKHRQPDVTDAMVRHLRGLQIREAVNGIGFDAFAIIVIDCDNVGGCSLVTSAPAPQPGDPLHYETFITRISRAYADRYGGT